MCSIEPNRFVRIPLASAAAAAVAAASNALHPVMSLATNPQTICLVEVFISKNQNRVHNHKLNGIFVCSKTNERANISAGRI